MMIPIVRFGLFGSAGVLWSVGAWLLGDGDGAVSLVLYGLGGASVTGVGAFVWVRFVTRSMLRLIEQQQTALGSREERILELEQMLTGGTR